MHKFRGHRALVAWLILGAIALGGGLIETHSHDGLTSGKLSSFTPHGGDELPRTAEHVESSTSIEIDFCLACTAGQREGVLGASHSASWSPVMAARGISVADSLAISGSEARPPAPRGPPTV